MMTAAMPVGASSAALSWDAVDWQAVAMQVRRLQLRIAKATREQRWGKVKALQWLLTHSLAAKLLAVRRIGQNRGRHMAGIDGVTWKTPQQKLKAALALRRRGYQAQPLRRIYIPKKRQATAVEYPNDGRSGHASPVFAGPGAGGGNYC